MLEFSSSRQKVDQLILEQIESIPHLEALLLLWNSRPKQWQKHEVAKELYIPIERAQAILQELEQHELIIAEHDQYSYNSGYDQSQLIAEVDRSYRQELIRISDLIHSKNLLTEQNLGA